MKEKPYSINSSGGLVCCKDYCGWIRYRFFFTGICVGALLSFTAVILSDKQWFLWVHNMFIG